MSRNIGARVKSFVYIYSIIKCSAASAFHNLRYRLRLGMVKLRKLCFQFAFALAFRYIWII